MPAYYMYDGLPPVFGLLAILVVFVLLFVTIRLLRWLIRTLMGW